MSLDLRPRVVFHTALGAVEAIIDPTEALSGNVVLPNLGSVPYTIQPGFPASAMVLQLPLYGPVTVPLNLFEAGSGEQSVVTLPVLGDVPYELTLGPPALAPGETMYETVTGFVADPMLWIGLATLGAFWLLSRRRA